MSRLDDIKARAEKFGGICPDYMYWAIRHVARNCDIGCALELDENHDCNRPDRYDGKGIAVALSDLAVMVAVVEEVQRVRDTMRAEEGQYVYPEDRFGEMIDAALRPVTEEGQQ